MTKLQIVSYDWKTITIRVIDYAFNVNTGRLTYTTESNQSVDINVHSVREL